VDEARDADAADALLDLIRHFEGRRERVTAATQGPSTTFKLLHGEPGFPPGMKAPHCNRLLRRLQDSGRLFRGFVQTKDRKWREVLSTAPIPAPIAGSSAENQPSATPDLAPIS
jgi:hypothetical protein